MYLSFSDLSLNLPLFFSPLLFSLSLVPSESLSQLSLFLLTAASLPIYPSIGFVVALLRFKRIRFFLLLGYLIQAARSLPQIGRSKSCGASVARNWTVGCTSGLVTPNLEACGSHTRRKNLAPLRHKRCAHYPLAGPFSLFLTPTCRSYDERYESPSWGNRLPPVDLLIILFRTFQSHPWPVFFYSGPLIVGLTRGLIRRSWFVQS